MKTISIVNLKGGVGKTVTTVNVAAILASSYDKKVLVIDADPQANTTQFYGLVGKDCNTLASILSGYVDNYTDAIYKTNNNKITCVPADIDLIEADIASVTADGGSIRVLSDFLDAIICDEEAEAEFPEEFVCDPYDYCLIDCPPSFTAASIAAIAASNEVIIPIKIDAFAIDGMRELKKQIDGVKQIRPDIRIAGVLVTMWHNVAAVVQGEELLRKSGLPVFQQHIRRSDKVDESTFARQPLDEYSKTCAAAIDYRLFVQEYLGEVQ